MNAAASGLRAAAISAAEHGLAVVPLYGVTGRRCACGRADCATPGKHPRVAGYTGKDAAEQGKRADAHQIREWWTRWPRANVGLVCGRLSGVDVLDVDPRAGGDDALAALVAEHEPLPDTPQYMTGGGGTQYLFAYGGDVKNTASQLGDGLDIRSTGGIAVLPPSAHASGRFYEWDSGAGLELPVAPWPAWLSAMTAGTTYTVKSDGRAAPLPSVIPAGQRHAALLSLAGTMQARGADPDAIEAALVAQGRKCDPPLPDDESRQLARDVAERYERGELGDPKPAHLTGVRVVTLADIAPEAIKWLWRPRIACGHLTALVGDGGVGKSSLLCDLAARITRGDALPGASPTEPRDVLIVTAEDHWSQVLSPRLRAMGADLDRIKLLSNDKGEPFLPVLSDPASLAVLQEHVRTLRPALTVLDPWQAFTGAGVDLHRMNESRALMTPLAHLAAETDTAITIAGHLTKADTTKAVYRAQGSADFGAAVRSMLLAGADPDNPDARALFHVKSNLAPMADPLGYGMKSAPVVPGTVQFEVAVVDWCETSLTVGQVLGGPPADPSRIALAATFVQDSLADGPKLSSTLKAEAANADIQWRTVQRAGQSLGWEGKRATSVGLEGNGWAYRLKGALETGAKADSAMCAKSALSGALGAHDPATSVGGAQTQEKPGAHETRYSVEDGSRSGFVGDVCTDCCQPEDHSGAGEVGR